MFEITIKGDTPDDLYDNLKGMIARLDATLPKTPEAKPARKAKAETPRSEPEVLPPEPADAVDAELLAPVPPAPTGASAIVDAGTGQPAAQEQPVVQMTFDEVRASAAKLAAKNAPRLAEILKTYGAAKLSDVPKESLGDFAADVVSALS